MKLSNKIKYTPEGTPYVIYKDKHGIPHKYHGRLKKCLNCKETFFVRRSKSYNHIKFCSYKCSNTGEHNPFYEKKHSPETIRKMKKSAHRGEKHSCWKGGVSKHRKYIQVFDRKNPSASKNGFIRRSRLIAEKCLGRQLTKIEVIHHINKIQNDDRPENLYLFRNQAQHLKFHRFVKRYPSWKITLISNIINL